MGRSAYPDTKALLITADAGGSNGSRVRLWKWELQQFANRTGMAITVCHFPPGTSKWNKIEHRLFSHIAMNWRGKPLVDLVTIISLIGDTTTEEGLRVRSAIDTGHYPRGGYSRRADGTDSTRTPRIPRRLELHHSPARQETLSQLFIHSP